MRTLEKLASNKMNFYLLKSLLCFLSTKRLFTYLKKRYSRGQIKLLNSFVALKGQVRSTKFSIKRLKSCLQYRVIPKFLAQRLKNSKVKFSLTIEKAFITDELQHAFRRLDKLRKEYSSLWREVKCFLSFYDLLRLCQYISKIDLRMFDVESKRHDKQISFLVKQRYGNSFTRGDQHILNLSSHDLSENESFVLGHGLKYCIPPRFVDQTEVLTEFEVLFNDLDRHFVPNSVENVTALKSKLAGYAYTYSEYEVNNLSSNFHKEHFQALKSLRTNKNIIITRPDKGNSVCILNRVDYVSKMKAVLSDPSKFIELGPVEKYDKTLRHQKNFCKCIAALTKKNLLPETVTEVIRPVGSQRPRLYGLPKIHKKNVPLRPVLSAIGSPQYPVAKYLASVLKPVLDKFSAYCVSDSFTFAKEINSTKLDKSSFLCSFDIKSLFTNVPLEETINICADTLYNDPTIEPPPFNREEFITLIKFATMDIEFSFDEVMYRQIEGIGMGNPLGSILSNIFVGYQESLLFSQTDPPKGYRRYVDDTFAIFQSKGECLLFLEKLNKMHPSLEFTCEFESDNSLPFLDVLVQKSNERFITSIYRKPTFTGQYVRWDSFCAKKVKMNLISLLIHRAIMICSSSKLKEELDNIRVLLEANGYPTAVINAVIRKKMSNAHNSPVFGPKKCDVYIKLPWLGEKSERFSHLISKAVLSTYNAVKLCPVFSSNPILPSSQKDILPSQEKSKIIYQFQCAHCGSAYVGKTSRRLSERIKEHIPSSIRKKNNQIEKLKSYDTAIARHLLRKIKSVGYHTKVKYSF